MRRKTGVETREKRDEDVRVETATTTEFLHAAKSGLLTELRNWMHLLLCAGICALIPTYIHICTEHFHTNTRAYAHARGVHTFGRAIRASDWAQNTSRSHFQFVSVYLKNGERNLRSARSCFRGHVAANLWSKTISHAIRQRRDGLSRACRVFCFRNFLRRAAMNEDESLLPKSVPLCARSHVSINSIIIFQIHHIALYFYIPIGIQKRRPRLSHWHSEFN